MDATRRAGLRELAAAGQLTAHQLATRLGAGHLAELSTALREQEGRPPTV
jgi:hypothetical protein